MTKVRCYQCGGRGVVGPANTPDGALRCPLCHGAGVCDSSVLDGVLQQGLQKAAGVTDADASDPFSYSAEEEAAMNAAVQKRLMSAIHTLAWGVVETGAKISESGERTYTFSDVELFDFVKKAINADNLVQLRGVEYWGSLYGAAADADEPRDRQPVGVAQSAMGPTVVCDDGAVFVWTGLWGQIEAIPGSRAEKIETRIYELRGGR
jgi:hypothetical protein